MKPVYQTKHGENGNCWQAAVASVLGLSLGDVPDFVQQPDPNKSYTEFLFERGFIPIRMPSEIKPECYYIAFGPSIVTGRPHAVVGHGHDMVHDPHIGRDGLRRVEQIHLIVPMEIDLS